MRSYTFEVVAKDPLLARDARPFNTGQKMRSLDWLFPSVLAGSLRTLLGKLSGGDFSDQGLIDDLLKTCVSGPFPYVEKAPCVEKVPSPSNGVYFHAPADGFWQGEDGKICLRGLRPSGFRDGEGWDLSVPKLQPLLVPGPFKKNKSHEPPGFWSRTRLVDWLCDGPGTGATPDDPTDWKEGFLRFPVRDLRTHVQLDYKTGSAEEGMLFTTAGLEMRELPVYSDNPNHDERREIRLLGRARVPERFVPVMESLDTMHPVGGERRLARFRCLQADNGDADSSWACPPKLKEPLADASHVRMLLASPGYFSNGWLPGWLRQDKDALLGRPPGSSVQLKLVSAAVPRWQALSGWSLAPPVGPKALRRLVPAGAVYFFEVEAGDKTELADSLWLASMSDRVEGPPQECNRYRSEGFGLALWGIWDQSSDS